jgi:hypothetical protein
MIEDFVTAVDQRLCVGRRQRQRVLEEVREHLTDETDALRSTGVDPAEAQRRAIDRFGSPLAFADSMNLQHWTTATRRAPALLATSAVLMLAGFLLAAATQPPLPSGAGVDHVAQVGFQLAGVAFQIAAVAGLCAMAPVAAGWRAPVASSQDRSLVRRAAFLCATGLGVTAVGWTVAVIADTRATTHAWSGAAIAGVIVMAAAALGAGLGASSVAGADAGPPVDQHHMPTPGWMGSGERLIATIRRHGAMSVATAAVIAGLGAMYRAETTVADALPWGLGEAAVVVAAFYTLGPILALSGDDSRRPAET